MQAGSDVTIAASGIMVEEALKARAVLKGQGIEAEVINVHTLKPLDSETILKSVVKTGCIVTAENHNNNGGLRSAVAEAVAENFPVPLRSVGFQDVFGEVGRLGELKEIFGLTAENIAAKAQEAIAAKNSQRTGGKQK